MTRSIRNVVAAAVLAALGGCASCGGDEGCPSGQTSCVDGCVDLLADVRNCGTCGLRCPSGAACVGGACACPAGQEVCNGGCIDPAAYATDPLNCGACGVACGALGSCTGGACACSGATLCELENPRCVDTTSDPRNCNGCGIACPLAGEACIASACRCPDTLPTQCPPVNPTACVNLASDGANCGQCGKACQAGATCRSGACACDAGLTECSAGTSAVCANLSADGANCGSCGNACGTGTTCTTGLCCPAARPVVCGGTAVGTGACCAGTTCCGTSCETEHTNGPASLGLGQHFYDCVAPGTYDETQARAAAAAWQPSATLVPGNGLPCITQECLGWRTASACGTWCWGGIVAGRVTVNTIGNACLCPTEGTPNWN